MKASIAFVLAVLLLCGSLLADVVIYGDTRSDEVTHGKIITAIAAHKPTAAFMTGDLNSQGIAQSEYDLFFKISQPLTDLCPLYPARGNHEKSTRLFLANFPVMNGSTYYSVVDGGIRYIILDSTFELTPGSVQYKWLQSALADSLPGILLMHHPVFSSGAHGDELGLALFLPQLLKGSKVKAVFSGHDHDYERSEYEGITYVVTGGGGAPVRVPRTPNPHSIVFSLTHNFIIAKHEGDKLSFKVWNLENELLDSFEISGY